MKNSKRDEKLDALLGKEVIIRFDDIWEKRGVLKWQGYCSTGEIRSFGYYLETDEHKRIFFRKSHVISAREVKE